MEALEKEEMLNLAEEAVKAALKKGATEAEAYIYEGQTTEIGIERGQITNTNRLIDSGLGVRLSVNKSIGFSYTNMLESKEAIEKTITGALNASKAIAPDQDWTSLPEPKPYAAVKEIFDPQISELHPEDLVKIASLMLEAAANTDKRVFPIEGSAGAAVISTALANSNGVSSFQKGTIIECSLATIAKDGNAVTPVCFEFNAERSYAIKPEWVGQESARRAISTLKTKRIKTKNAKLILTQFALQSLVEFTLKPAVKADNVQRNQSAFKGKIGEQVASDRITIYDDGLLLGGLRTWPFDGEGIPHQKTKIIEKGVLKNFLHDHYTAKKEGQESTGNASRVGYLSTPQIEPTNLHLMPGNQTPDQIIDEVTDGLIVFHLQGAHSSNPLSGDFSVVATPAWQIKKGEIANATRGVMLAGNIFEVLKSITGIANNERKLGYLVAPWVIVENLKVIGK
ncbi:TldD/PmbA family protein [Candidatus Bathyarchaeota archaeon]|nr:TldD/PmbA family protein [Candidatus Bathyarchaeota archaeon]